MVSGAVRLLVWVRYRSDAERKRLESIVDKYRDTLRIVRPGGAVYIVEARDRGSIDRFVRELYAKLGGSVSALLVGGEYRAEPRVYRARICFTGVSVDRVWGYVEAFMVQNRGALLSETRGGRRYSVYVKGEGEARVLVRVEDVNGVCVYVEAEGYSRAPDLVGDRFSKYLLNLGGRVVE